MSINGPTVHHAFSEHYYKRQAQFHITWFDTPIIKCPLDLWLYQEIIHATRPDVVVETGTFCGGSALYLANLLDIEGNGRVVSIDIQPYDKRPQHDRITYFEGRSSTDPDVIEEVRSMPGSKMVILDSDHSAEHVFDELRAYAPLVSVGCYLIVEDTNFHAYPNTPRTYGPAEAIKNWQPINKGFEVDRAVEKFGFSQNPNGYLKRVR
jgi:cephalosporin hydroxylase